MSVITGWLVRNTFYELQRQSIYQLSLHSVLERGTVIPLIASDFLQIFIIVACQWSIKKKEQIWATIS